jgi:2'-5' RNA ligase
MRAFIAIDLPPEIQAALARQQAACRAVCPDARWTRLQGTHLTLKFLGEISDQKVSEVTAALSALPAFPPFAVEVKGFGFFPDTRRPSVFWAGIVAPQDLADLVLRVEDSMEKLGFARERRAFNPHLTLARFKATRRQPGLITLVEQQADTPLGRFQVSEFFLFESKLSPRGAEYRKVARFPA